MAGGAMPLPAVPRSPYMIVSELHAFMLHCGGAVPLIAVIGECPSGSVTLSWLFSLPERA